MTLTEFSQAFDGLPIPTELEKLFEFDTTTSSDNYFSAGFEMGYSGKGMIRTYSEDERFLESLLEFAQASHTASMYCIWRKDGSSDLSNCPVVIFGSEGGYHVVANNLKELLELLAFDADPMADWDRAYYYKDAEDEPSLYHGAYVTWLADNFGTRTVTDPAKIITAAQEKHGAAFKDWMKTFQQD